MPDTNQTTNMPAAKDNKTNDSSGDSSGNRKRRIKKLLIGVAPQLAHAIGGPFASTAVKKISGALFGTHAASEPEIDSALLTATPEQLTALRLADLEFQRMLQETSLEQARINAADRSDARTHQRTMNDWTPSIIGALVILGFFVVLAAMVARQLPEGAETEFSIMLGALATMTAAVVNYFFGSSAGSKEKTKLMSSMHPAERYNASHSPDEL